MFKKGNLSLGKYPSHALPYSMLGYTENYEHKHLNHGVGGKRKREVKRVVTFITSFRMTVTKTANICF